MDRKLLIVLGLGATYLFLKGRQPVFVQNPATGQYQPATFIDSLAQMVNGTPIPVGTISQPSYTINAPGIANLTYNPTGASSLTLPAS